MVVVIRSDFPGRDPIASDAQRFCRAWSGNPKMNRYLAFMFPSGLCIRGFLSQMYPRNIEMSM